MDPNRRKSPDFGRVKALLTCGHDEMFRLRVPLNGLDLLPRRKDGFVRCSPLRALPTQAPHPQRQVVAERMSGTSFLHRAPEPA